MPVESHGFNDLVAPLPAGEKASPSSIEISPPYFSRDDEQENHADRHVRAVEARDQKKGRAKLRRSPGVSPRPDPFPDQRGPFESLRSDECGANAAVTSIRTAALTRSWR